MLKATANLLTPKKRRELSHLQMTILKIGLKDPRGRVSNSDVLIIVYGFHPHHPRGSTGQPQLFRKSEIGFSRYNSASVAVAKAFGRLVSRGYAERTAGGGIALTRAGVKAARGDKVTAKVTTPNAGGAAAVSREFPPQREGC